MLHHDSRMQLWSLWLLYGIKVYLHLNPERPNLPCIKCFAAVCLCLCYAQVPGVWGVTLDFPGGGSSAGRDRAPRWHQKPPDFWLLHARG